MLVIVRNLGDDPRPSSWLTTIFSVKIFCRVNEPTYKAKAVHESIYGIAVASENRLIKGFTGFEREFLNLLDKIIGNPEVLVENFVLNCYKISVLSLT